MREFKLPTEVVELPSKGMLYPKESLLSKGKIEIKYPTAKEEDILSNVNYIKDGTVFNRFYESIVVSEVDIKDLLIGDRNALMIAARILGKGKDYVFENQGKKQSVDLSELKDKKIDHSIFEEGKNEFNFHLPNMKVDITFKLLTTKDEEDIAREIKSLEKQGMNDVGNITTRFKYIITSVDGEHDKGYIRKFVDNFLIGLDLTELRKHINIISPDIELTFFPIGSEIEKQIPFGIDFLWPNS